MTIQITTLENGLRIITDDIPGVATTSLGLWVNVGARHESAHVNGISHFLEHMAFKGTTTRSAKQIAEDIENVGGHLNAYTSRETTAFLARILKEDTPLAIEIIADIIQNSLFDPQEISRERDVILQEIGQANDTPDDIIFDHFQRTAFPHHPLGRSILGPPETVRGITQEDLKKYIEREYSTSRMVFSAAGAIEHKKIVDLCQKYFSRLSTASAPKEEVAQYRGGHFYEKKPLEQVHVLLGFESCPYQDPHHHPFFVLSTLLGGGMSSRLFQEVREKKGLVYSIYSFHSPFKDTGVFGIYAGTGETQVHDLLPTIKAVLENLSNQLDEKELERSKAQFKAAVLMSLESTSSRCEQQAQQMLIYGRPLPPQEIIDRVNAVTQATLQELIERLFSSSPTFVALGPGKEIQWT